MIVMDAIVSQSDIPPSFTSVSDAFTALQHSSNVVGVSWMISSALLTTYSTTRFLKYDDVRQNGRQSATPSLDAIPRPALLTLYRFAGSFFLGLVATPSAESILDRLRSTVRVVPDFALPAVLLFAANFANSVSLDRIGISLTYTSKCAIPLITVVLTLLLDGWSALPNNMALLSLLPIAFGIGAASWDAPTFECIGFLAAMSSAIAQSALNVSSKRIMQRTGVTGPAAQRAMVSVGLVLTLILTFLRHVHAQFLTHPLDGQSCRQADLSLNKDQSALQLTPPPLWLTFMAAVAYHVEYSLSFMFVSLVQPITYGACDAVRRLSIIMSGRAMFGGAPLTRVNLWGIALALSGALAYSVTSSL